MDLLVPDKYHSNHHILMALVVTMVELERLLEHPPVIGLMALIRSLEAVHRNHSRGVVTAMANAE